MDFDTEDSRREEVFRYIVDRFGKDHVAQIITYGKEKLRSGIIDLCRVFKEYDEEGNVIAYGQEVADTIKKSIPYQMPDQTDPTYQIMMGLAEKPEEYREKYEEKTDALHKQAKQFKAHMEEYPKLNEALKFMEGLIRSYSKHAAAVVITDDPITDYIPVYKLKKDDIMPVTAFSMKEIDKDLKMLKLDALSIANLTTVRKTTELIRESEPKFDVRTLSIQGEKADQAYRTIRDGHTVGVFQLNGGGITQYVRQVKPRGFNDITDISALYRPGPKNALVEKGVTMTEKYVENYDDQSLDDYLETIPSSLVHIYQDTRGIMVYQEQIMQLAQDMAGYTMGGADLLRRAIG